MFYNGFLLAALLMLVASGCGKKTETPGREAPPADINAVLSRHADSLMKIPGIVGVYVGERPDHSPVLRLMAVKKTRELEEKIPTVLEGYPVEVEETGEIKPMQKRGR